MRSSFAGKATEFQATNCGTLALFVALIERMKLESIIDRHLPVDAQAEFSLGNILTLLIAARLHFPMALTNVAEWAEQSDAEFVWGSPLRRALGCGK